MKYLLPLLLISCQPQQTYSNIQCEWYGDYGTCYEKRGDQVIVRHYEGDEEIKKEE